MRRILNKNLVSSIAVATLLFSSQVLADVTEGSPDGIYENQGIENFGPQKPVSKFPIPIQKDTLAQMTPKELLIVRSSGFKGTEAVSYLFLQAKLCVSFIRDNPHDFEPTTYSHCKVIGRTATTRVERGDDYQPAPENGFLLILESTVHEARNYLMRQLYPTDLDANVYLRVSLLDAVPFRSDKVMLEANYRDEIKANTGVTKTLKRGQTAVGSMSVHLQKKLPKRSPRKVTERS